MVERDRKLQIPAFVWAFVLGLRREADHYHLYITNLPREEFLPSDLAKLYRCRWEVELLFRELKTQYELDEFNTYDPAVVEIL